MNLCYFYRVFNLSFYAYQSTILLVRTTHIFDAVGLYFTKYFELLSPLVVFECWQLELCFEDT